MNSRSTILLDGRIIDVDYEAGSLTGRSDFLERGIGGEYLRALNSQRGTIGVRLFATGYEADLNANVTDTRGIELMYEREMSELWSWNIAGGTQRADYAYTSRPSNPRHRRYPGLGHRRQQARRALEHAHRAATAHEPRRRGLRCPARGGSRGLDAADVAARRRPHGVARDRFRRRGRRQRQRPALRPRSSSASIGSFARPGRSSRATPTRNRPPR